ncbi:hypothetical protein J0383_15255 [Flavobacterium endoglycinae]|uniref:Uncharacterized protein n=1 Tax=Flavobacterium endoglycinae TaxID=2816357 RepID=A0ABX7QB21_9FLAO|nr:DUF6624 domain-containing protein [Flavobacterium endoglycinae]QSW87639.1 hypothetical protein J0383_15255 [Flavobacterium endoglycinae]
MDYQIIAKRILELKNADLNLREKLIKSKQLSEGYNQEMEKLHNQNAKTLAEIIEIIGYPTIDKVGKEANEATWLIIQHSIGQPDFMRKCAAELKTAVNENKADAIHLAYLTDRIAVFEDKPQLYGTQFDWDETGKLIPNPFDDLAKVNERRKAIGLITLEEQTESIQKRALNENQTPPKDFNKQKEEMNEWRKKVGWIK